MGEVVNRAAKLAAYGNESHFDEPIMVGDVFYGNLNDHSKGLLTRNSNRGCYHGNVFNTAMEKWHTKHC